MAELQLPEGPYEIESLMREIGRLLESAACSRGYAGMPHPRVLKGEKIEDLLARLRGADQIKHISPSYSIKSHRPIVGRFIDALKKLILWGVKPHLDQLVENQESHNESMLQLHHALIGIMDELHRSDEARAQQLRVLEQYFAELQDLFDRLEKAFQHYRVLEAEHGKRIQEIGMRNDVSAFFTTIPSQARLEMMRRTRGHEILIRKRFHEYLPPFLNRPGPVLDLGCGRGEFMELLRDSGVSAWGCDLDPVMVDACRERGLDAREVSVLDALQSTPEASLGGVFCAQVVEHLYPADLLRMILLAKSRLAPGGILMIETLNPQSLAVLSHSYFRDLEHKQPVDPDYLSELLIASGFQNVRWEGKHDFEPTEKIILPALSELSGITRQTYEALESIVERVNRQVWGAQDYCLMAEIGPPE